MVELAPVDDIFFIREDPLVDVVRFKEGGDGLFELVVDIEGYLEYFCDIADHVDGFDFDEPPLVDVVVYELSKCIYLYFTFIIVPQTVVFN